MVGSKRGRRRRGSHGYFRSLGFVAWLATSLLEYGDEECTVQSDEETDVSTDPVIKPGTSMSVAAAD
jgi:hypothetical protein